MKRQQFAASDDRIRAVIRRLWLVETLARYRASAQADPVGPGMDREADDGLADIVGDCRRMLDEIAPQRTAEDSHLTVEGTDGAETRTSEGAIGIDGAG